jgi:hypothetical protein
MPVINGKYYMNPQYGRALERDRTLDEEHRRVHGEPEPSWLDHHLGFAGDSSAQHQGKRQVTGRDTRHDKMPAQAKGVHRSDRAAMSYSEKEDGTVAEHEAIQSTVMNRVASGEKQYVGKGQAVNEHNVIHAPNQYQGVPRGEKRRGPFLDYQAGKANGPGAANAEKADESLRRNGKATNDATFFIVNPGGKPPTDRQVRNLGNVEPAGHVGDVYLYKPKPPLKKH